MIFPFNLTEPDGVAHCVDLTNVAEQVTRFQLVLYFLIRHRVYCGDQFYNPAFTWCLCFMCRYYISKGAIVDQLGGDLNSTPLHWATR